MRPLTFTSFGKRCLLAIMLILFSAPARPQSDLQVPAVDLSIAQILERMEQHNHWQAEELEHYHALRHYAVEYRGFFKTIVAKMDVEIDYSASSGKYLQIISQTGSRTLCEKVLKQAVKSEQEASQDKRATGLTEANYKFHLVGTGSIDGHAAYILNVEPITASKFLYRGKIWVDAKDFAVAKLEVEPASSPSFWISRTSIHHANANVHGFWLPEQNRSETSVRVGGKAVLTIDYGTYQVVAKGLPSAAGSE